MTETATTVFAIGDRVEYIGDFSPDLVGKSGIVQTVRGDSIDVAWEGHHSVGVFSTNVAKATEECNLADVPVGTRVYFVGTTGDSYYDGEFKALKGPLWRGEHDSSSVRIHHNQEVYDPDSHHGSGSQVGHLFWFVNTNSKGFSLTAPTSAEPVVLSNFPSKEFDGVMVHQYIVSPSDTEVELAYTIQATKVAEGELASLREAEFNLRRELNKFKEDVRQHIIAEADSHGWCEAGVNRHFDALGLEEWTKEQEYEVDLTIIYTTSISVMASDPDEASEMAESNLSDYWTPNYETPSDVTVDNVGEV